MLRRIRSLLHIQERQRGNERNNRTLVSYLKDVGAIHSGQLAAAFLSCPRNLFFPDNYVHHAFVDRPVRIIEFSFNISAPRLQALCLEKLQIKAGHAVLDVGSGSGFVTAVAAFLAGPTGTVCGLDIKPDVVHFAEGNVNRLREQNCK